MKRIHLLAPAVIFLFAVLVGCTTVSETGRRQFNFLSAQEEMTLGFSEFDKMKKEVPRSKDAAASALLQKVGARIAKQAEKAMPNAQWEFVVFASKEVNALSRPNYTL